jgi:PTS system galactitol-specific IIA component
MIFLKKKTMHILVEEASQEVSTIIAVADIDDRWALLRRAASILVKKGYVSPAYLEALIEREKRYPTGLRINDTLSVALPHTHVMYTIKPVVFVILLKNPVRFNRMDSPNESVYVNALMIVALKNLDRSAKILRKIGDLLAKDSFSKAVQEGRAELILKFLKSQCFDSISI